MTGSDTDFRCDATASCRELRRELCRESGAADELSQIELAFSDEFPEFELTSDRPASPPSRLSALHSKLAGVIGDQQLTEEAPYLAQLLKIAVDCGLSFKRHHHFDRILRSTLPELVKLGKLYGRETVLEFLGAATGVISSPGSFDFFCEEELPLLLNFQSRPEAECSRESILQLLVDVGCSTQEMTEKGQFKQQELWSAADFFHQYIVPFTLKSLREEGVEAAALKSQELLAGMQQRHGPYSALCNSRQLMQERHRISLPESGSDTQAAYLKLRIRPEALVQAGLSKKERRDYLFLYEVLHEAERSGLKDHSYVARGNFCTSCLRPVFEAKKALGHAATIDLLRCAGKFQGNLSAFSFFCCDLLPVLVKENVKAFFVSSEEQDAHISSLITCLDMLADSGLTLGRSVALVKSVQKSVLNYGRENVVEAIKRSLEKSNSKFYFDLAAEIQLQLVGLREGNQIAAALLESDSVRMTAYRGGLGIAQLRSLAFDQKSGLNLLCQSVGVENAVKLFSKLPNAGIYGKQMFRLAFSEFGRLLPARAESIFDQLEQLIDCSIEKGFSTPCQTDSERFSTFFAFLTSNLCSLLLTDQSGEQGKHTFENYLEFSFPRLIDRSGQMKAFACLVDFAAVSTYVSEGPAVRPATEKVADHFASDFAGQMAMLQSCDPETGAGSLAALLTKCLANQPSDIGQVNSLLEEKLIPLYQNAAAASLPGLSSFFVLLEKSGVIGSLADLSEFSAAVTPLIDQEQQGRPYVFESSLLEAAKNGKIGCINDCRLWISSASTLLSQADDLAVQLFQHGVAPLVQNGLIDSPQALLRQGRALLAPAIRENSFWEALGRISLDSQLPDYFQHSPIPIHLRAGLYALLGEDAAELNFGWQTVAKSRDILRSFVDFLDTPNPDAGRLLRCLSGTRSSLVADVLNYQVRLRRAGRRFFYDFSNAREFDQQQRAAYTRYSTRLCKTQGLPASSRARIDQIDAPSMQRLLEIYAGLAGSLGRGRTQNVLGELLHHHVMQTFRHQRYLSQSAETELAHFSSRQQLEWRKNRLRPLDFNGAGQVGKETDIHLLCEHLRSELPQLYTRHLYAFVPRINFEFRIRQARQGTAAVKGFASRRKQLLFQAGCIIENRLDNLHCDSLDDGQMFNALRELRQVLRRLEARPALNRLADLELFFQRRERSRSHLVYAYESDSLTELLDTQTPSKNCLMWERASAGTKGLPSFAADAYYKKVMLAASADYGQLNSATAFRMLTNLTRRVVGDDRLELIGFNQIDNAKHEWSYRISGDAGGYDQESSWSAVVADDHSTLDLWVADDSAARATFKIYQTDDALGVLGPGSRIIAWQNMAVFPTQYGTMLFPDCHEPRDQRAEKALETFVAMKAQWAALPLYSGGFQIRITLPASRVPFLHHQRIFKGAREASEGEIVEAGYGKDFF